MCVTLTFHWLLYFIYLQTVRLFRFVFKLPKLGVIISDFQMSFFKAPLGLRFLPIDVTGPKAPNSEV